jgi:hypothetical protein
MILPPYLSYSVSNKVLIYIKHHSVCPLVGIGTPPTPLTQASGPPPRTKKGGGLSPAAKGVGECQFQRLEKKLSTLPTLWCICFHSNYRKSDTVNI